ncbi:MAG: D-isomer specific 2-hydroxyacid dehydrogenase family protein [Boseongicola sp.]|nr:D-isomer specific 2-hydroxyacid dehydrogenase family protein [Boseongicola sp.]
MKSPAFVDCYGDLADHLTPEILAHCPGIEVISGEPASEDELIARLAGRRHAMVYMGYLSKRVLEACPELRSVAYLSTGLATHADLQDAGRLGVRIEGVRNYGDRAVAEHAITLALSSLKRIAQADRLVRQGGWQLLRTEEIAGATFGIVGFGGIGRETARLAKALGAEVIGWSRSGDPGGCGATPVEFDEVVERSDILTLHLALTPDTAGIVSRDVFQRMKQDAILVNTARGELIDRQAMLDALASGRIGHIALDVFHQEPLFLDDPLIGCDRVTLTPHSGWYTGRSIDNLLVAGLRVLRRHIEQSGHADD